MLLKFCLDFILFQNHDTIVYRAIIVTVVVTRVSTARGDSSAVDDVVAIGIIVIIVYIVVVVVIINILFVMLVT